MAEQNKSLKKRGSYVSAYARPSDGFQWIGRKRRFHETGGAWTFMDANSVAVCLYKAAKQGLSVERHGHIERIVTLYAIDKLRAGHYLQLTGNDVRAIQSNLFRSTGKRISLAWASKVSARVCRKIAALSSRVRLMRTVFNAKLLVAVASVGDAFKQLFAEISLRPRSGAPVKPRPTGPPAKDSPILPAWIKDYDPKKGQAI